jgi:hypothetical protein
MPKLRPHSIEWKNKRTVQGLCYRCGKPRDGKQRQCQACREIAAERLRVWNETVTTEGRCHSCGQTNDTPHRRNCSKCAAIRSARVRKKQNEAESVGLCQRCYKQPISPPSTIYCAACYPRHLASNQATHSKLHFGGNREMVLERDAYRCVACGSTDRLEVHHIDRNRSNTQPENLITLCHPCHYTLTRMMNAPNLQLLIDLCKGAGITFSSVLASQLPPN